MCTGVGRNAPCEQQDEPVTEILSGDLSATVNLAAFLVALNVLRMSLLVVSCSLNQWSMKSVSL